MSDDPGQTVHFREFVTSRDELRARLHALELEQARLSASLMHLPRKVDELVEALNTLSSKVTSKPAEPDHATALAIHRALDALPKVGGGSGGFERILTLALTAFAAFMIARFFIGG